MMHPGISNPRAVVSVAFSKEEFALVAKAAEEEGMKISTFIRKMALDGTKVTVSMVEISVSSNAVLLP